MDNACGGIGKRRLVRVWSGARKGKRRQHGGKDEQDEKETEAVIDDEEGAPAPSDMPPYEDVCYTNPRQESPGRQKGHRSGLGQIKKKSRGKSLYRLIKQDEKDLFEYCVETGFLIDRRLEPCPKCNKVKLQVEVGRKGDGISYVCGRPCRYRESVTEREPALFLKRTPLSKQMMVIYCGIQQISLSTLKWKSGVF